MKRLALRLSIALAVLISLGSLAQAQSKPEFRLGFKALADQVPAVVGEPLEDEHWGDNGDSLQMTTKGLMAWRKADNWTAFTDGSRSWINGPAGVQERANDQRFAWEQDTPVSPRAPGVAATTPTPIVSPPTATPTSVPPTATPYVAPTATRTAPSSSGGGYTNVDGVWVPSPSNDPTGASAQCRDGTYSYSQHRQGTCSGHGGVARWLN